MQTTDVWKKIEELRIAAGDPERAHAIQDTLYVDVLHAIAEGADHPQDLAQEALKAADVDFDRWTA